MPLSPFCMINVNIIMKSPKISKQAAKFSTVFSICVNTYSSSALKFDTFYFRIFTLLFISFGIFPLAFFPKVNKLPLESVPGIFSPWCINFIRKHHMISFFFDLLQPSRKKWVFINTYTNIMNDSF